MSGPRKPPRTEAEAYDLALRALARRSYSAFQLEQYLQQRGAPPELARQVVRRLLRERLLDDARFARQFAFERATGRQQGHWRILHELRRRGVAPAHIQAALSAVFSETDERELLHRRIERWLRQRGHARLEPRHVASLQRALLRAGFDAQRIRDALDAFDLPVKLEAPEPTEE